MTSELKLTTIQLSLLENYIGIAIDDCPEILSINPARFGNEGFEAHIQYDGTNNKNNKGNVYFNCYFTSDSIIEDFEIINITGSNYRTHPLKGM